MLAKAATTSHFSNFHVSEAHTLLKDVLTWIVLCMWHWQMHSSVEYCRCLLLIHRRTRLDTNRPPLCCGKKYLSVLSLIHSSFSPLCHSNDILQSYQPAVQHHLRVLHWGHLSSHDGLQHVSHLQCFWFIHCWLLCCFNLDGQKLLKTVPYHSHFLIGSYQLWRPITWPFSKDISLYISMSLGYERLIPQG